MELPIKDRIHAMSKTKIIEVSDGAYFANGFFKRAFGDELPEWGHHLVCFYQKNPNHLIPLGYLNLLAHETVILVGGGVTNGAAFSEVDPDDALQIREEGGVLFKMLRYGFENFADHCEAFFGHAGNERALEVDLKAGFELTQYENLIVNFHKPLDTERKTQLIEELYQFGSF